MNHRKSLIAASLLLVAWTATFASELVSTEISVPDTAEKIRISDVYLKGKDLIVIARVAPRPPGVVGGAMISKAKDAVFVDIPKPAAITRIIVGKTWNWESPDVEDGYIYVGADADLGKWTKGYRLVYSADGNAK